MKYAFYFFLLFFSCAVCRGQGANNNYEIDREDVKNIFELQGIHVFKYPFKVKKGEYVSVSYEVYESGKLTAVNHILEDFQIDNDILISQHILKKDTLAFYRFYFRENDDSLKMREVMPGMVSYQKIDLSKVALGGFNSEIKVPQVLSGKQMLLYYRGFFKGSDKMKKNNGFLPCATGSSREELIKDFDFVIIFYAEKIEANRRKSILDEIEKEEKSRAAASL